ncbi:MAG: hypothetical protein K2P93_00840 [Alphaproteobacteria bacterium]|nr:hypothetical protein [Alphaproteobacteria bacterium]
MAYLIGFSGIGGAGKTTLTKYLGAMLNATTVFWDDYDKISSSPDDYIKWYEESQDYSVWIYKDLAKTLKSLKEGRKLKCPATQQELKPTPFIIVDAPLGRKHIETSQYIDLCIHIDIPLDIALARRLLRDFKNEKTSKEELLQDVDFYLNYSRKLFASESVKTYADIVIDGTLTCEENLNLIMKHLIQEGKIIPLKD